ncbi:MAG: hypothetical protein IJW09_02030 [Clostridia bacterium]|nr:hypothetical protein [Clostridia bacterium]
MLSLDKAFAKLGDKEARAQHKIVRQAERLYLKAAEAAGNAPVSIVDISTPKTQGRFAERRKQNLANAKEVIKKPYLNRDTNTLIFITNNSYTHAFSNGGELQLNAAEHFP